MFKFNVNSNAQKIIGVIFISLIIYVLVHSSVFNAREGLKSSATSTTKQHSSSDQATKMRELNDQTLTDIQQLQELEKGLYAKMEGLSANKKLTQKNKDKIIENINELSQLRMNLYANLKNNYDNYQTTSITTSNTYDEQSTAVAVVEKELKDAKARLESMQDDKNNKIRYIGVNTYYGKQYEAHSRIMKIIIFMCIPIIVISVLASKGLIPSTVVAIMVAVIIAIGVLFLGRDIITILNRDKMNYDRTNWYFDSSRAPTDSSNGMGESPWASKGFGLCIGQECCDEGSTYDSAQNICVVDKVDNDKDKTESMCSMNNGGKYAPQYSYYSRSLPVDETVVDTKLNNYVVFDSVSPLQ